VDRACIADVQAYARERYDQQTATVWSTRYILDDGHIGRNVHRGIAATCISWLRIDGVCALPFQMAGRSHISDAGLVLYACALTSTDMPQSPHGTSRRRNESRSSS
jgi:hypothetical protein